MEKLNNLPEEIMLEILTRLPTESVLDCKLVCKPWRDLVRHPSFFHMHLKHLSDSDSKVSIIFNSYINQQEPKGVYYTEYEEGNCDEILVTRKTRIYRSPEFQNCRFVGSCNGLICFSSLDDQYNYGPLYIWNPITREYIILPDLGREYQWNGFGYSASTNEYKVVRICFTPDDPNSGMAQVYTVGGGNGWRSLGEIDLIGKNLNYLRQSAGVFANGSLYWVNCVDGTFLAFCLTDEKFSEFPSPSPPCVTRDGVLAFTIHLGVLGDFLCVTYYNPRNWTSEIWLQKKNKYNSDLRWIKQSSYGEYMQLLLSRFTKSGRFLGHRGSTIYSYDPKASLLKIVAGLRRDISEAIPHKNTLVSLKALGEKDTKTMEFGERARSSEVVKSSTKP